MEQDQNESQNELDSSDPELGDDSTEDKGDYELLTIQVDENLEHFNEDFAEETDDEGTEAEMMAASYAEQELIDKLLKDSISIADATIILSQELPFEEEPELQDPLAIDQNTQCGEELVEQERTSTNVKRTRRRRSRRTMPPAMVGLMGEANVKLCTSQYAEAEKMCLELIRRCPYSPEPFETLAMIYEEKSMPMKSVQYWFISAFLSSNPHTWEKLADIFANQLNDPQQAVFCYNRAITADQTNINLHHSRAKLLEYLGETARAIKSYVYMLKFLEPDQGSLGIELSIEIAKIHHANDNITKAQVTLENALVTYRSSVSADAVNLLLEILLQQDNYSRCVEVLLEHNYISLSTPVLTPTEFSALSPSDQVDVAKQCTSRSDMPLDLMAKFAISLIHLQKCTIAHDVVEEIKKHDVLEFGDLFLEVSEAYNAIKLFKESVSLLEPLLVSEKFNLAAVWLQYAEALAGLNKLPEAADAYSNVIKLAPHHTGTRVSLSNLLKRLGRNSEALSVLSHSDISGPLDSTILYQKCLMLKERGECDEFVCTAKLLLQRHFLNLRSKEEVEAIIGLKRVKHKYDAVREIRVARGELNESPCEYVGDPPPTCAQQWEIFIELCRILFNQGRMEELQTITFNALGSHEFMKDPDLAKEVEFLCLIACLNNDSFYFAYNIVREIVLRQPECARAWNILCYVISKTDDIRHNKFLLRLTVRHYNSLPLSILNGHNCLAAGSYKLAMAEYTQVFKQERSDPLMALMLGLTYSHMACQKFSGNKHDLTIKGAALLQTYLKSRGECQESYYNLGRAMHQLNILPQTIHYYQKALELRPVIDHDEGNFDLTREIAFNLSLVYKKSENTKLIRYYLCKYIRV